LDNLYNYPLGDRFPEESAVVIEITKGSRNKYEYDATYGAIRLDRVLSSPLHYVAEYGFFPQTLAGDGDPADVLVPMEEPTFPGCIIEVRPVGLLKMEDEKGEDYKILAVPVGDRRYAEVTQLDHLPPHLLLEIEHFFTVYKNLDGLYPSVSGWENERKAKEYLRTCHETYLKVCAES
jgi:inorganic pyrophosphatase